MTATNYQPQTITLPNWKGSVVALGNVDLLRLPLTAFFCSRQYPAKAVIPIYDWAKTARQNHTPIISPFHSPLEQDVLKLLLNSNTPLIQAIPNALPKRLTTAAATALPKRLTAAAAIPALLPDDAAAIADPVAAAIAAGRMLILSQVNQSITRSNAKTSALRNQFIFALAAHTVVGYANPQGALAATLPQQNITHLTLP